MNDETTGCSNSPVRSSEPDFSTHVIWTNRAIWPEGNELTRSDDREIKHDDDRVTISTQNNYILNTCNQLISI
jgi:hypothetical protein